MRVMPLVLAAVMAVSLAAARSSAEPDALAPSHSSYHISAGDKLKISVFNEANLSGEFGISAAGNLSFPLLGNVAVDGMTPEGLQQALHRRLADEGLVQNALVTVEVVNYRPYYILGEVNKPGEYPYSVRLRVEQAVAAAGGFTYRANRGTAFLRRLDDEKERHVKLRGGSAYVMPGDTIRIGERYF